MSSIATAATTESFRQQDSSTPVPPGPPQHWLLGNLKQFQEGRLKFYERCRQEYGPISSFRLGSNRFVLLAEPEAIEEVLVHQNKNFRKHYVLRFLEPVLGKGLLTSEGEKWFGQRKLMQPAFLKKRLTDYAGCMSEMTQEQSRNWPTASVVDLHQEMMHLTMRIAARTMLGVTLEEDSRIVGEALEVIQEDFSRRFNSFKPLPVWMPTKNNRNLGKAIRSIEGIIDKIIEQRRSGREGNDVLSVLLRKIPNNAIGRRMLRDEVMTLLLAGHDTTANTLTWTWHLLSQHPEIEQRFHAELDTVIGDRLPTLNDVPQLAFTSQILKESMRLFPAVYAFGREALVDCEVSGYSIKRGTSVLSCQWVVHRDGRFYDRPCEFEPDRWTPEFEAALPHYAYFPFGGGPRICIGQQFSLLEATLILATIGRRYRFDGSGQPEVIPHPAVTLRPEAGLPVIVKSR